MKIMLHAAKQNQWDTVNACGSYRGDTLDSQGYIHCSKPDQLIRVANFIFRGRTDLVLLCIDRPKVGPEIRDENLEGGDELFPHIYGPLNVDAVTAVLDFQPRADGTFVLPEALDEAGQRNKK
jgi:uncharacterized protein (DUF952 family)